jgi:hypothetical protein
MASWLNPIAKTILLCEDVLPGPAGTGNVHLMNVFSALRPRSNPSFPLRLPKMSVFLQLTDAEGEAFGKVVVREIDSDEALFGSADHRIQFDDRLHVKWLLFRLNNCVFPSPGIYLVEFYFADRLIVDYRLPVSEGPS